MMAKAWLALGANIGHPPQQLHDAIDRVERHPKINLVAQSSMRVTAPWGKTDQPDFHNMAVAVETSLSPEELLDACLAVEAALGRVRLERWGPRLIDIDIIAYERLELQSSRLTLPHPHAHERDFVLVPMREIAPDIAEWIVARAGRAGPLT